MITRAEVMSDLRGRQCHLKAQTDYVISLLEKYCKPTEQEKPMSNVMLEKTFGSSDKLVEHPKHYNSHPSGIECIEVIQHYNFNVGSAMKYLWRQGLKDSEPSIRDLSKAIEYIKFEIERIKEKPLPEYQVPFTSTVTKRKPEDECEGE